MGTLTQEEVDKYQYALKGLFPDGDAWRALREEPASVMFRFVDAQSVLFSNISCILLELRKEFFPSTITELLDRWESDYGLPDGCFNPIGIDARLKYLINLILNGTGATKVFFIQAAANLGLTVEIQEYDPFRLGDLLGKNFSFTSGPFEWIINIVSSSPYFFRLGDTLGTPFQYNQDEEILECFLDKAAPKHTRFVITSL